MKHACVQAAAKAKKVVDKEKKAREGLKKLEVSLCFVRVNFGTSLAVKFSWLTCAVCNAVAAAALAGGCAKCINAVHDVRLMSKMTI